MELKIGQKVEVLLYARNNKMTMEVVKVKKNNFVIKSIYGGTYILTHDGLMYKEGIEVALGELFNADEEKELLVEDIVNKVEQLSYEELKKVQELINKMKEDK